MTVLLHRLAFDTSGDEAEAFRRGAAVWARRSLAAGDTLPARIESRFRAFDDEEKTKWRRGERYYLKGIGLLQRLEYVPAEAMLDSAVTLFRETGDRYREGLASSYVGLSALNRGDLERASRLLKAASKLQEEEGDLYNRTATLGYLAQIDWSSGDYHKALSQYVEALALFRRLNASQDIAETLQSIAWIEALRGDYPHARDHLEEALRIHREMENPVGISQTAIALGNLARRFGDFFGARASFATAETVIEKNNLAPLRSDLLNARGVLAGTVGDHRLAAVRYEEAARIDSVAGNAPGFLLARLNQTASLVETGEYRLARTMAKRLIEAADSLSLPTIRRYTYEMIGRLALAEGDLGKALENFEAARSIARDMEDVEAEAGALLAIARTRYTIGEKERARESMKQACERYRLLGDAGAVVNALAEYADLLFSENRIEEASKIADEYNDLAVRTDLIIGKLNYALLRSRIDVKRKEFADALSVLDSATSSPILEQLPELAWRFDYVKGKVERHLAMDEEAAGSFESAIEKIERLRSEFVTPRGRAGFFETKRSPYEALVLLYLRRGDVDKAFLAAGRSRMRSFLDNVAASPLAGRSESENTAAREERERRAAIDRLREEMRSALEQGDPDRADNLRRELEEAYRRHEESLGRLPDGRRGDSSPPWSGNNGRREMQESLDDGEILLEYFNTADSMVIFVLTAETLFAVTTSCASDDLDGRVRLARSLLSDPRNPIEETVPVLRGLYNILINPVSTFLDGARRVTVIPGGPLRSLPFAALVADAPPDAVDAGPIAWLGDRFELCRRRGSFAPFLRKKSRPAKGVTIFAYPGEREEKLPHVGEEARKIGKLFPRNRRTILVGKDAGEALFGKAGEPGDYIHIASHGVVDPVHPLYSYVELAGGGGEDGRLSVYEIIQMRLDAPLVFLGACETALGAGYRSDSPEGYAPIGLTGAFLHAGTDAVVATLWPVDDRATSEFAVRFYRRIVDGRSNRSALSEAQRELRKDRIRTGPWKRKDYRNPYYWAGFVLLRN